MKRYNRPSIVCKEMENANMICASTLGFNNEAVSAADADAKDRILPTFSSDQSSDDTEDW